MEVIKRSVSRHAPIVLMAVFLLAPVLAMPDTEPWRGVRSFIMQAAAFGLLVLLLARVSWSAKGLKRFLTTGPSLPLLLFVGWAALSFALTAPAGGRARNIALVELLRLASGAIIFFAVMYRCSSRKHLGLAAILLLGGGIVAALAGLVSYSESANNVATAAYGNPQPLATFLLLLLPVAVVFTQAGEINGRRVLATVAAVIVAAALLLTYNRSAWLGAAVGLLVMAALVLKSTDIRRLASQKHCLVVPVVAALACIGIFFLTAPNTGATVGSRAQTLASVSTTPSFQFRAQMASVSWKMFLARPLTGYGLGSFVRVAPTYAKPLDIPVAAQVEDLGFSLSSDPHNEYLLLGAELGLIGLLLYLAVLVGFFYRGVTTLSRITSETRKWLLIAAMGAVAAQVVDALGNPGWRFGDVSPLFWVMLGIGMAATRTHRERREAGEESPLPVTRPLGHGVGRLGWQAMCLALAVGLGVSSFAGTVGQSSGALRARYIPGTTPRIKVHPRDINFRSSQRRIPKSRVFVVTNRGERGSLLVGSMETSGPPFSILGDPSFSLLKGSSQVVRIVFDPPHSDAFFGTLTVRSNDPSNPVVVVPLTGRAR